MNFVRFFLVTSLALVAGATPQDLNDLFSVYAGNLNTSGRQYYTVQYLGDTVQNIPTHYNISQEDPDFEDVDDFADDDDDGMEDFFYENGFVEISNDDVYDYSFKPNNAANDSTVSEPSPPEDDTLDVDEKTEGHIFEQTMDDEEDGADIDQPVMATNQSTTTTPEQTTQNPLTVEDTESPVDLTNGTDYDNSLNPELTDHIIPAFVHPINRPSNEWPLDATQTGNPTNQNNRKPARRPPNRRRRPQGNRRPQQGARPQKNRRRRRRKPQKGNRKPIRRQNNKQKRRRYKKRPQVSLPPNDPNFNRLHKYFASRSCGECQCGVTTTRRIVGGTVAAVNEFPWLALIAYNGTIQCGGTLINDRFVLTAAHCVRGFAIKQFQIRFLEYNRAVNSETTLVIRRAARIFSLNNYNARTADNDVALIRLSRPIAFASTTVRPICLPPLGTNFIGLTGIVAGWGATSENGRLSNILRKVKVPIISNEQCQLAGLKVTKNMLCAGRLLTGGIDACQGDSGGPLMVIQDKRYYLAGVVSWGDGCARPKKPGVYARVTQYLQWIRRLSTGSCLCNQIE